MHVILNIWYRPTELYGFKPPKKKTRPEVRVTYYNLPQVNCEKFLINLCGNRAREFRCSIPSATSTRPGPSALYVMWATSAKFRLHVGNIILNTHNEEGITIRAIMFNFTLYLSTHRVQ